MVDRPSSAPGRAVGDRGPAVGGRRRVRQAGRSGSRWCRQVRAFAGRSLRQYTRSPLSLAFLVAWPAFWYVLVVYVLFRTAPPGAEAVAGAKAALAVSFGLFGALTVSLTGVAGSFAADVQTKRYRKFRSLPVSPSADLTGRFVAGTALSVVSYVGLLVIGAVDGAAFALHSLWSPAVVVLSVAGYTAVGIAAAMALAAFAPRPEYATMLATTVLMLTFFGTGFNGVVPALFPGPNWLLNAIPVSLITRMHLVHLVDATAAGEGAFAPPGLPAEPAAFAVVLAYGVGALAAGAWVMGRAVYAGEAGE